MAFTNGEGIEFVFPADPRAGTRAAPFAALLDGSKRVLIPQARPREHDARLFEYVGIARVDRQRIVQVGTSRRDLGKRRSAHLVPGGGDAVRAIDVRTARRFARLPIATGERVERFPGLPPRPRRRSMPLRQKP